MIIDIKDGWGFRERFSVNENGKHHGKCIDWYKNGNRREEVDYANGNLHGKYFYWNEDGNKELEIDHVNDKPHGKCISWYESGNKERETDYVNGHAILQRNYINGIEQK